MPTYYEVLGLAPAAQVVEIEKACDALYEKWHRLITHHALGDQATQNLKTIETIRATLLDGHARAIYDGGIGVGGVGGLLDPDLIVQRAGSLPPIAVVPSAPSAVGRTAQISNPWTCPSCGVENLERAKFCVGCASQLIRQCPACRQITSLVATGICWECGSRYDEEMAQRQRAEATARENEERQRVLTAELGELEQQLGKANDRLKNLENARVGVYLVGDSDAKIREELQKIEAESGPLLAQIKDLEESVAEVTSEIELLQ